jgi:hypothetical protein
MGMFENIWGTGVRFIFAHIQAGDTQNDRPAEQPHHRFAWQVK